MASILRVKANWTGFPGAPGVSVFHFAGEFPDLGTRGQAAINALTAFFGDISSLVPNNITITVDQDVEQLESTTGDLIGFVPGLTTAGTAGANTANWAGPSGAVVNWSTNTVRNARRMRGRTFLVPLSIGAYDDDGTLTPGAVQTLQGAVNTLLGAVDTDLLVYGRPTPNQADGVFGLVTAGRVPDLVAVLRSRRD